MRIRNALFYTCAFGLLCCLPPATESQVPPSSWGSATWGDAALSPVPTGPALVQQAAVEGSSVGSIRANFAASNTAGSLIVAFVRMSTTTQTVGVTDTAGNLYSQAISQVQTADGSQIRIFYARAKGGANAVTATFSATNNHPWLAIYEYTGVIALDQKASAQGNSTTPKATITVPANELVFVGVGLPASFIGSTAAGAGFEMSQQDVEHSRAAVETAQSTTPGTATGTFTLSAPASWAITIASFK